MTIIRSLALALLCSFAIPASALAADPAPDPEERGFCKLINTYRAQNRLPALKLSVNLTKSAKWMAADMARQDILDHTDSLGRSFSRRISSFGYTGSTRGENIAGGTNGTAQAMFNMWKASAVHKKNMLSASYKVIGIGRAYRANTMLGWHWATDFGGTVDRTIPC
jgi:uncharacterized protein YkwD